uniref:Uncharacterized protein n=1 Tax=viral metagenome TaxID=1070528 RepID=A0A6C0I6V7_9ZZZZ
MPTLSKYTVPKTNNDLEQINTDNDSNNENDYQINWSAMNKIINRKNAATSNTTNNINFSQGTEQTISNISDLQTIEMKLYESLDNPNLTQEQRSQIIDKINQISQTRMTLYKGISNMASAYQQNVTTSNNSIQEQRLAIDIVEHELNVAKKRLNLLQEQKYNKLRLVEINTYYGKQYNAYKEIAKQVVYICILVLIIVILGKKGILPTNLYITINGIIITIGAIIIGKQIIKLFNRDNMNFDEYDWYFDKSKAPTPTASGDGSSVSNPWATPNIACVGAECCVQSDGFVYDSNQNICVLGSTTNSALPSASTTASSVSANTPS